MRKIPWWLRKIDLVREELRAVTFPRTTEEGIRQCAELSSASMGLLREEIRRSLRTRDERVVGMETRRLLARFSKTDGRWKADRRRVRAKPKGQ